MKSTDLKGMTVNERLFELGLMDEFDQAAHARDRIALIATLIKAEFSEEQAQQTIGTLLASPERYGF